MDECADASSDAVRRRLARWQHQDLVGAIPSHWTMFDLLDMIQVTFDAPLCKGGRILRLRTLLVSSAVPVSIGATRAGCHCCTFLMMRLLWIAA
jgi:hypothetical protein